MLYRVASALCCGSKVLNGELLSGTAIVTTALAPATQSIAAETLLKRKIDLMERCIGLVLSGGNIDLDTLPWVL